MATRPQHFLAGPSETRPAGPWVRQEELEGEGVREAKEEGAREGGQDGAKMERETRKKTKERGLERQRGRVGPRLLQAPRPARSGAGGTLIRLHDQARGCGGVLPARTSRCPVSCRQQNKTELGWRPELPGAPKRCLHLGVSDG